MSTLLVKENCTVFREDLGAAVACFPRLMHMHLSDGSAQPIDDAFLARLAACCPKLTAFHLGNGTPVDGLLALRVRALALADLSAVTTPEVKNLIALEAIAIDTAVWDYDDLEPLAHLPRLTSLSVLHEVSLFPGTFRSRRFSFVRLSSLKLLDLGSSPSPPFDEMFPSETPCSLLERVSLYQCDELQNLPHNIIERLPCLHDLSISACDTLLEQPKAVTLLTGLRSLKLARCPFVGLQDYLGEMNALTTLMLHKLNIYFPASCSQLKALHTLAVIDCEYLDDLPDPLSALTVLSTLCLAGSPFLVLPNDIRGLTNLQTVFVKTYRAREILPSSFTQLASLAHLELHECELVDLPEAVGELRRLRELYVLSCPRIQKLPDSVAALLNLEVLVVDQCGSLFSVPKNLIDLTRLKQLDWNIPMAHKKDTASMHCKASSFAIAVAIWQAQELPRQPLKLIGEGEAEGGGAGERGGTGRGGGRGREGGRRGLAVWH
ncbi:unnamed protein product [Closterium sp. Naga37s-1]|nr:unnamed protein product [Closterium sp. Naga37s-1]